LHAPPPPLLQVVELSSHASSAARAASLARFKSGAATVLVASDAMTRGMDVEHVSAVINYDAPVYAKTYVHRWGLRAGGRAARGAQVLHVEGRGLPRPVGPAAGSAAEQGLQISC
jgi:ATP-dependent RNA helicase DDX51/DBP6